MNVLRDRCLYQPSSVVPKFRTTSAANSALFISSQTQEYMSRFPKVLIDCLWHSTSIERFESILKDGAIRPEPDIPDSDRWCTSRGPRHYPFVRTLGGVSLFDFSDFNPTDYGKQYSASWRSFVPDSHGGGNSVWVEVNRQLVQGSLIEGKDLVRKWKAEEAYGHNIMPIIEAAHIGSIPVTCFSRVIVYQARGWEELSQEYLRRHLKHESGSQESV